MKELSFEKMEMISGGLQCSTYGGLTVGLTAGLILIGVASGGVGFAVAGGLIGYFGTAGTLLCAMY